MNNNKLIFDKKNYTLLIVSLVTILVGFITMSLETEKYGFGFLGLTLGPILLMIGFIIPFFAIFTKTSDI